MPRWVDGWVDGWVGATVDGWVDATVDGWVDACDLSFDVCVVADAMVAQAGAFRT